MSAHCSANILGFEISEEKFPVIYRWAQQNHETLEEILESMVATEKKAGNSDFNIANAVIILESDLR